MNPSPHYENDFITIKTLIKSKKIEINKIRQIKIIENKTFYYVKYAILTTYITTLIICFVVFKIHFNEIQCFLMICILIFLLFYLLRIRIVYAQITDHSKSYKVLLTKENDEKIYQLITQLEISHFKKNISNK